jgi:hypothetical protein
VPNRRRTLVLTGASRLALAEGYWGAALLLSPGPLLQSLAGKPIGQGMISIVRVLGARQLLQAAITARRPTRRALNAIIRDLMNTRDGATYFAGRVWGVFTHYNLGGSHPLTGYSVPNFEFEDGAGMNGFMYDGKGILLDFNRNASLKTLTNEYGDRIKYISGKAKKQLGISAVLIRPDGIIAWASDSDPDFGEIQKAADRIAIRNPC